MTQVDVHKEFSSHKQKIGWRIRVIPIRSSFEFQPEWQFKGILQI